VGWFSKKKDPPPPPPPFSPPKPEPEARAQHFARLFRHGEKIGDTIIEVRTIGQLYVPTGRLIACDPFVPMDQTPLTTVVPTGTHPVDLSIARFPNEDERIAAARLRFSDEAPTEWLMGLRGEDNPATLKEGESFAYGVDAGLGCFVDAESFPLYDEKMAQDGYFEVVMAELKRNHKNTRDWTLHHPIAGDPHNVAIFSSGWGDGIYTSYFGMRDGKPVCLVTDFMVVRDPSSARD
jgi:hypothetical protein